MDEWEKWDSLAKRVKGRRKLLKLSQEDLAEAADMSQSDISKIERGDMLQTTKIAHLARALQCDAYWLATSTGTPDMEIDGGLVRGTSTAPATRGSAPQHELFGTGITVPVLAAAASMGPGVEQHDDVVIGRLTLSPSWVSKRLRPLSKIENLRFIHGYGDSMEPTFYDGDILLVDAGIRECKVDGIYVLEANDRLYIKRVRQRMDASFEISSDNVTVKTVDVLDGSRPVSVLGRVVWTWNGKKL